MKKFTYLLSLLMVGTVLMFTQCRSKKETATVTPPPGETRVEVLCSGPDYFSNSEFFRANSVAESPNQANSKRMALSNARAELAAQIEVTVKSVIDNYVQDITVGNRQEFTQRYEGLTREVINQRLTGTRVICEELTRTPEGRYKTYIAIELSGEELVNAMNDRISRDERLRLDYDYERFKDTFNQEMEQMRQDRGY
ncbi:LPP20 family lipoprotein [Alkalitalea saponilacus]|uniref:LPP20 lipoprotein n=1 Tax=Alkalitalea saponilacus TaxID=889453 RepID=A0A1T5HF64_9BACT|nr:LPP20 family lipoprotein [Alkalitalea saponilacus]SKC19210.1 LPP20 lipoprotein [Alkalitalea saponilacus]